MKAAATLVAALLLVSGCGSDGDTPSSAPTAPVTAVVTPPTGVTLAAAGTQLAYGQPADVGFTPNASRATTLRLSVVGVRTGRIADLAAYALDEQSKTATPYYVRVTVANLGPDDVARATIPLLAETSAGGVLSAAAFTQPFARCRSSALPDPFAAAASASTCLLFLVPQGATLVAVSNRAASGSAVVTWKGTVKPPRKK